MRNFIFGIFVSVACADIGASFARADEPPEACNVDYKLKCACSPIGHFEGFQLYLVEKCLEVENWHLLEKRQYEQADCEQELLTHPVCRWLGGAGFNQ